MKKNFVYLLAVGIAILVIPLSVSANENLDADADGLSDNDESTLYHTDPNKADTDGDGFMDGAEVASGYSPLFRDRKRMNQVDSDGDGLNDALEVAFRTHLINPDTDGDGQKDGKEVAEGHNPLSVNNNSLPRRVEVDLSRQQLYYYLGDVRVGTIPVSTGIRGRETPKGEFQIQRKAPVVLYAGSGYYFPNTKWNLQFKKSYYLHGAYWHNQFGKRPMSHGCVNIAYKNAEKLYKFLKVGDKVKVFGVTPRGLVKAELAEGR